MSQSVEVRSYSELAKWAGYVHTQKLSFLIVHGPPGTGKSRNFTAPLDKENHIEGRLTGIQLFMRLYELRDEPVVIDDVDEIFRDKQCVNLIKLLCQTENVKTLQWNSSSSILDQEGVPRRFDTKSRVVIIVNDLGPISKHLGAVIDRAFLLHFVPSNVEIHEEAKRWAKCPEVVAFIEEHLPVIPVHSLRSYVKAKELWSFGGDWREYLRSLWDVSPKLLGVMQLLRDKSLKTAADRVQRFVDLGYGSRDTYMRWQRKARERLALQGDHQDDKEEMEAEPTVEVRHGPSSEKGNTSIPTASVSTEVLPAQPHPAPKVAPKASASKSRSHAVDNRADALNAYLLQHGLEVQFDPCEAFVGNTAIFSRKLSKIIPGSNLLYLRHVKKNRPKKQVVLEKLLESERQGGTLVSQV